MFRWIKRRLRQSISKISNALNFNLFLRLFIFLILVFLVIPAYRYIKGQEKISDLVPLFALSVAVISLSLGQSAIIFPYQQIFYKTKLDAYIDIYQKARDVYDTLLVYLGDKQKKEPFLDSLSEYNKTWSKYSLLISIDMFMALSSYSERMYELMPSSKGIKIPQGEQAQEAFYEVYADPFNELSYKLRKDLGIEKLNTGIRPLLRKQKR